MQPHYLKFQQQRKHLNSRVVFRLKPTTGPLTRSPSLGLWFITVRQAGDVAPRTLCCNAYTWKNIFSTKYKLSRTKNNCVHAQLGQIMNNKIPKDKKAPLALLKSRAEKQGAGSKSRGLGMPPALSTNKAVGKPPKPPLWLDPWTCPYPTPI